MKEVGGSEYFCYLYVGRQFKYGMRRNRDGCGIFLEGVGLLIGMGKGGLWKVGWSNKLCGVSCVEVCGYLEMVEWGMGMNEGWEVCKEGF